MKNLTGLELQESVDIYINGSPVLKAQHEHELSVEADHEAALIENEILTVWDAAHITNHEYGRMGEFLAQIDYNEMCDNRDLNATDAFNEWEAEEARKLN